MKYTLKSDDANLVEKWECLMELRDVLRKTARLDMPLVKEFIVQKVPDGYEISLVLNEESK